MSTYENAAASTALATAGAIFWSVQLIPQIVLNYRRGHAEGLQPSMMVLWSLAGVPLGIYTIAQDLNVALQVQAQILTTLSLVTYAQCKYYQEKWSIRRCVAVIGGAGVCLAGIEVGIILAVREPIRQGVKWPATLFAILAAVLLSLGVLRHYVDVWQTRSVRGISFGFVVLDSMGDLTSLLSLFFEPHLDVLGVVIYASELALWLGLLSLSIWYHFYPSKRSQQAAALAKGPTATATAEASSSTTTNVTPSGGHDNGHVGTSTGFELRPVDSTTSALSRGSMTSHRSSSSAASSTATSVFARATAARTPAAVSFEVV